jgi:hypothetical protein
MLSHYCERDTVLSLKASILMVGLVVLTAVNKKSSELSVKGKFILVTGRGGP